MRRDLILSYKEYTMNIIKLYKKNSAYIKCAIVVIIILITGIAYSVERQGQYSNKDKGYSLESRDTSDMAGIITRADAAMDVTQESYSDGTSVSNTAVNTAGNTASKGDCIYVYVFGEVENPGVVECARDSRVYEVVELCGGYTDRADRSRVNPVLKISDGDKIYIPYEGEEYTSGYEEAYVSGVSAQEASKTAASGRININSATKEQLVTLPGIGDARAQDIISYRSKHGAFKSIEEIKKVSGIKDNAFNKIKDYICV